MSSICTGSMYKCHFRCTNRGINSNRSGLASAKTSALVKLLPGRLVQVRSPPFEKAAANTSLVERPESHRNHWHSSDSGWQWRYREDAKNRVYME